MTRNSPLELELRKLDLTEKEVKIYLAGLELGPCSVQKIAELVNVARPTTYEIIKRLEKKGLFEEGKEKKKKFFSARSPENILGLLRTQKRELEEKEREFVRIISTLESKYSKEQVKIFNGKEGLLAIEEIISFSSTSKIIIFNREKNLLDYSKIFLAIKKRLGNIQIQEMSSEINGTLIIFDKLAFFPRNKQISILID